MIARSVFLHRLLPAAALSALVFLSACDRQSSGGGSTSGEVKAGKFTIVATRTDNADVTAARQNAESVLQLHPDLNGMVGLYGYNPPSCLEALREAQKNGRDVLGKVLIFGFDGLDETLAGLAAGHVAGTVVQQPFEFGYQSMKTLKALHDGQAVESKNGVIGIPVEVITRETVAAYQAALKERMGAAAAAAPAPAGAVKFGFVTNNQSSFWEEARAGCLKAQADLGIAVDFQMPEQQDVQAQNRIVESMLLKGEIKGLAISVISPDSQGGVLQQVADKMPLITHDSDAAGSARKVYLGTNNYDAGKALGEFIRKALPDGGKLAVFVGSVDAQNAADRLRGLKDALSAP